MEASRVNKVSWGRFQWSLELLLVLLFVLIAGLNSLVVASPQQVEKTGDKKLEGIQRKEGTRLRVVCYNGYWTSIFPKDNGETRSSEWMDGKGYDAKARQRRFAAWAPQACADIWAMQETIYSKEAQKNTTAKGIGDYFSKITGKSWHAAADGKGRMVLSRYPILWSGPIRNARGMAALVDLPTDFPGDLLIINLHFFTKPKETQIRQATNALIFVEAVRRGEYTEIPKTTPIMICGDFNSFANERPYQILTKLNRDARHGDGKALRFHALNPKQLDSESMATYGKIVWQGEVGKSVAQSQEKRIDHILAPMNFMKVQQAFVFNSLIMPADSLKRHGVERDAILLHRDGQHELFDHLPVFLDLQ